MSEILPMTSTEVQELFAPKLADAHPLVQKAFANCVGALKSVMHYSPRQSRSELQLLVREALIELGGFPLADRKKGRILGEGCDSFRLHLSIHQDTADTVTDVSQIWVNYMVTGDLPTGQGSVGAKLRHKGRVPITKVAADFCDAIPDEFKSQDQIVKNHIVALNSLVGAHIVLLTKSNLVEHYQAFQRYKNLNSCMSKSSYQYEAEDLHPIDCYENSPNLSLGLLIQATAEFSPDKYSFSGRIFMKHNLGGQYVGYSNYYGSENHRGIVTQSFRDSGLTRSLYGGLLNVQMTSDNELIVPYVDVVTNPQQSLQSNHLVWLADLTDLESNEVAHLITDKQFSEGESWLFIGQPMHYSGSSFHGDASNNGRQVCRLTDVEDACRPWAEISGDSSYIYVESRQDSYPEDDVVWSDARAEYIHENDVARTECGGVFHEDDEGELFHICGVTSENIVADSCVWSEYEGEYYGKEQVGGSVIYAPEENDHYHQDSHTEYMEYHGYEMTVDMFGDSDWSKDHVFSNFRGENIDSNSAIETPDQDSIYAEDVISWVEANPDYKYEDDEFVSVAA